MARGVKNEITRENEFLKERLENLKYHLDKAHEALHEERDSHDETRKKFHELNVKYIKLQSLYKKEVGKSVPTNLKSFRELELEAEIRKEIEEKEQYKKLLDEEQRKHDKAKKRLKAFPDKKTYQANIDEWKEEIENLKQQLQAEKEKHSRKGTGRKRNNNTPDEEVLRLRAGGNTVKTIHSLTGISTATINRILNKVKTE